MMGPWIEEEWAQFQAISTAMVRNQTFVASWMPGDRSSSPLWYEAGARPASGPTSRRFRGFLHERNSMTKTSAPEAGASERHDGPDLAQGGSPLRVPESGPALGRQGVDLSDDALPLHPLALESGAELGAQRLPPGEAHLAELTEETGPELERHTLGREQVPDPVRALSRLGALGALDVELPAHRPRPCVSAASVRAPA